MADVILIHPGSWRAFKSQESRRSPRPVFPVAKVWGPARRSRLTPTLTSGLSGISYHLCFCLGPCSIVLWFLRGPAPQTHSIYQAAEKSNETLYNVVERDEVL